ncbi:cytochrome P450 [Polyangium aurulentum]|uniref:cytochrome P450 n=1 Tax=Polyangium aurulentum TaxID=2567896 RepID=UPI0010ADAD93|nr:cytochrome P450 [Polyangium aurulentum]UQA62570.1 cytochrome P450 [Polyangium aurulentum]
MTRNEAALALEDVQGHLLISYSKTYGMHHARYLFLHFADADRGRRWVEAKIPEITTAKTEKPAPACTLNLAFTYKGLEALGLAADELQSFPDDFREGMRQRATILGDVGENAPERWDLLPEQERALHALVIVYARTPDEANERIDALRAEAETFKVSTLRVVEASSLEGGREHFGFTDGSSNPSVAGDGNDAPSAHVVAPGAFLLDHPDDFEAVTSRPKTRALRRNGTYLALRKLWQDVPGFRRFLTKSAAMLGGDEELVAAKLMGRWRSGAPLVRAPEKDAPDMPVEQHNAFGYRKEDPQGLRCPFGAHIRRANPRDALPISRRTETRTHQIIRRGMAYGPPLVGKEDDGVDRGLVFIAYCASLSLQFEIVQKWLNSGNVGGEPSTVPDPIVGDSSGKEGTFTIPMAGPDGKLASVRTLCGLPSFVRVRGGEYFFAPGIDALRYIATTPATLDGFLQCYAQARDDDVRKKCVEACLLNPVSERRPFRDTASNWRAMRKARPILDTPHGVLVSKFHDACEVLSKPEIFSVREYNTRMVASTGAFLLGFDGERHEREASIARRAVQRGDVSRVLARARAVTPVSIELVRRRGNGKPNLYQDVVIDAVVRTVGEYFGVPGPSSSDLFKWLAAASAFIFFPLRDDKRAADGAAGGFAFQCYLEKLLRVRMAGGKNSTDDVLGRLLSIGFESGLDLDDIRRTLGGLVSGTIVPTAMLLIHALRHLEGAREQGKAAQDAAQEENMGRLESILLEAARFDPFPSLLYRTAVADHEIAAGTPRATRIRQGSRVIVSLASAMADDEVFENAEAFEPARPKEHELLFGHSSHACIGKFLAGPLMAEIAAPILRDRRLF